MVRTPGFHCCGLSSVPSQGTEISQVAWCGQKRKKRKQGKGWEEGAEDAGFDKAVQEEPKG